MFNEEIEKLKINGINEIEVEDRTGSKSVLCQCTCISTKGNLVLIYRPKSEEPKVGEIYSLFVTLSSKLKPVVKYKKCE